MCVCLIKNRKKNHSRLISNRNNGIEMFFPTEKSNKKKKNELQQVLPPEHLVSNVLRS